MLSELAHCAVRWSTVTRLGGAATAGARRALSLAHKQPAGDDDALPSLRGRLEADAAAALDWPGSAPSAAGHSPPSLRSFTASFATRLAKTAECQLEAGTPRYLDSALDPGTTQCRLVVEAAPPFRATWASDAWKAVAMNGRDAELAGRPAAALLPGDPAAAALRESLTLHQRGCASLAWPAGRGRAFPARLTVSPLIDPASSETSHMLFVLKPL